MDIEDMDERLLMCYVAIFRFSDFINYKQREWEKCEKLLRARGAVVRLYYDSEDEYEVCVCVFVCVCVCVCVCTYIHTYIHTYLDSEDEYEDGNNERTSTQSTKKTNGKGNSGRKNTGQSQGPVFMRPFADIFSKVSVPRSTHIRPTPLA